MSQETALSILKTLVQCPSVTPDAGAALDAAEALLAGAGFNCQRLVFADTDTPAVDNLFARFGTGAPHLCLAGHVDVVPPGDETSWTSPPFAAEVRDGVVYGRGAEDMKGAVAAAIAAATNFVRETPDFAGSLSILLTGDEEGPAVNGTRKVLEWMSANGQAADHCLLGEPASRLRIGDTIKIGRRGSLNGRLRVAGRQGHAAYPHLADNPIPKLMRLLDALLKPIDEGTPHFEPTNLQITTVDVANLAVNVIPAVASAAFNVRFNDRWTAATLEAMLRDRLGGAAADGAADFSLETDSNAEAFLAEPGPFIDLVRAAIASATGIEAGTATNGGTSDARFITKYCPVVEVGLVGRSMHQVDEHVLVSELEQLDGLYRAVLDRYFSQ